jgi:hypothetical protein
MHAAAEPLSSKVAAAQLVSKLAQLSDKPAQQGEPVNIVINLGGQTQRIEIGKDTTTTTIDGTIDGETDGG